MVNSEIQAHMEQCQNELNEVGTAPEVSVLWGVPYPTVVRWCNEGRIIATMSEHSPTWLISLRDMRFQHGLPKHLMQR
jgi:hypothetical protein